MLNRVLCLFLLCFTDLDGVSPDAPPGSPCSSVRSSGDGSSCDTPPASKSVTEDGRSGTGKYCDCCYCEFFGHAAVSTPNIPATMPQC